MDTQATPIRDPLYHGNSHAYGGGDHPVTPLDRGYRVHGLCTIMVHNRYTSPEGKTWYPGRWAGYPGRG